MPRFRLPDGAALHVERREGGGVPVVLLHGALDSSRAWDDVAARLHAAGRDVWLVDDRAHGGSEPWRAGHDWSPRAAADDLAALLREAAPGGAHLVGHSRGATAAAWLAMDAPELARSLSVVASPPQASEAFRAHFRRLLAEAKEPREAEALRYLSAIPDEDFPAEALRRFRGPCLVVEPSDDPLYAPTSTLFWRAFLPYADFERPPGGHRFFARGEGAEWLARRLLAFLEAADGR